MISYTILNLRYLCHPEAYLSDLNFKMSMNDLSFDTAKLGIKNTPLFLFVSFLIIRKIIRRTYIFS